MQGRLMNQNSEIWVPHAYVGVVIGRGGDTIRKIQAETGAHVQVCIATHSTAPQNTAQHRRTQHNTTRSHLKHFISHHATHHITHHTPHNATHNTGGQKREPTTTPH